MMMDYAARYGLEFNPFLKNAKDVLLDTSDFTEGKVRLNYLGDTRGFGVLTGEPGRGKSTLARIWASSLNPSLFRVSYHSLSSLTVMDFYRQVASGLGAAPSFRKNDLFDDIQREIKRCALEKRITPVIIIDEADMLSHKVLSDLQSMFNFEMDSRDLAVILLVGQPRLNTTLNQSTHEALRQRIVMNYHMGGITKEEGRRYVLKKLDGAGSRQDKTAEYTLAPGEMTKTIPATKEALAKYFAGYLIHHDEALETNAWGEEVETPASNSFYLVQRETDDNCYINCLDGFAAEIEVHYLYMVEPFIRQKTGEVFHKTRYRQALQPAGNVLGIFFMGSAPVQSASDAI